MSRKTPDIPRQMPDESAELFMSVHERMADGDPTPTDRSKQVTPDTCAIMREMNDRGMNMAQIAAAVDWVSYNTVRRHVNGNCACDTRTHVHYDECMRLRVAAEKGAPTPTLVVLSDLDRYTVWEHLTGECGHENGIPPLSLPHNGHGDATPIEE